MITKTAWIGIVGSCIGSTCLLISVLSAPNASPALVNTKTTIDSYVVNATYDEFTPEGLLKSHVIARKAVHYEHQDTTHFEQPVFRLYTKERIPWTISADSGQSSKGNEAVHLIGHVHLHQANAPAHPQTTIVTTDATVFPQKSFAQTKAPVTILRSNSTVNATGLTADFKTGIIRLLSASKGTYAPPPTPSTPKTDA